MCRYRFAPISFFPKFDLEYILEMQFCLSWYAKMPPNDNMDFRECFWWYERLQEELKEENKNFSNSFSNIGDMIRGR